MVCTDLDTGEEIWSGSWRHVYPGNYPGFFRLGATRCRRVTQVAGARCRPDGACEINTEEDCGPPSVWMGEGVECEPDPCQPVPVDEMSWGQRKNRYR